MSSIPSSSASAADTPVGIFSPSLSSPSPRQAAGTISNRQFVLQYVDVTDSHQRCTKCNKKWMLSTNVCNIVDHFKVHHRQVYAQRPAADGQASIKAALSNQESLSAFDDIVELFIRHPALPLSLSKSKAFRNACMCMDIGQL